MFISYAQNYEDVMLFRALKDIKHGFYVDVGAMDPTFHSVTKAFYDRGWRGINIEPVINWHQKLIEERTKDININAAIFDKPGLINLYNIPDTGLATFDESIAKRHSKKSGYTIKKITIPALTLDEILKNYREDIHFLKIDVEGAEPNVLTGINLEYTRPWIIIVEALEPLSLEPNYHKWEYLLTDQKYDFVYFDGLNRFYIAREHEERKKLLNTPPNIFDVFIKFSEYQTNIEVVSKKEENQALKSELTNKNQEFHALKSEFTNKLEEIHALQNKLIKKTEDNKLIQTMLTNKIKQNKALKTELTKKKEENQTLKTELTNIIEGYQTLQTDLTNKIEENQILQNAMKTKETKIIAFADELEEIKSSKAWKLALFFRRLRYKFAPPDSWLIKLYQLIKIKRIPIISVFHNRLQNRKILRLIRSSDLFNKDWYLSNYPDVAQSGINPAQHYLIHGGFEGRDPGPNFNSSWYLKMYSDVKAAGINPLVHYLLFGKHENRKPHPNSDFPNPIDLLDINKLINIIEEETQSLHNNDYWKYYRNLFTENYEVINE